MQRNVPKKKVYKTSVMRHLCHDSDVSPIGPKLFMSRIITIQNPCSIDYDENCLIIISDSDELCIHWPSRNLILSQIVSFAPGIDELQIYLRDEMVISVRGPVEGDLSVSKLWAQALLRFEQISR